MTQRVVTLLMNRRGVKSFKNHLPRTSVNLRCLLYAKVKIFQQALLRMLKREETWENISLIVIPNLQYQMKNGLLYKLIVVRVHLRTQWKQVSFLITKKLNVV